MIRAIRRRFWQAMFGVAAATFVALFAWAHSSHSASASAVALAYDLNSTHARVESYHAVSFQNQGHAHTSYWANFNGIQYGPASDPLEITLPPYYAASLNTSRTINYEWSSGGYGFGSTYFDVADDVDSAYATDLIH